MDLEMLNLLADKERLTKPGEAAEALGCSTEDALRRLVALVRDGYVAGPVLARWKSSEDWTETGYGLLSKGREALEAN